jgi:hypothetical protein
MVIYPIGIRIASEYPSIFICLTMRKRIPIHVKRERVFAVQLVGGGVSISAFMGFRLMYNLVH